MINTCIIGLGVLFIGFCMGMILMWLIEDE
jgi:hypothetical protein